MNQTEQIIKQVINSWHSQNKSVITFFNKHADEVYLNEVAPGRNRAIYLLGHLVSASDGMLPLFGIGERLFPELQAQFSTNPDRTFADIPTVAELKQKWEAVHSKLSGYFATMSPDEWLSRHTSVSEEDFAVDPLRNKLNVLLGRTVHQGYHLGQLTFLK